MQVDEEELMTQHDLVFSSHIHVGVGFISDQI